MVFNSLQFGLFFALVFAAVHALRLLGVGEREAMALRLRNVLLLTASYVFYGFWDWRFLGLIMLSTGVDFVAGKAIAARPATPEHRTVRLRWLRLSLVVNLGLLAAFKYLGFFVDSARAAFEQLGIEYGVGSLEIILPVGISFYTFQTLSYTIDIYRGRMKDETSLLRFATYVAFFPQLVAGPIERARDLLPQFSLPTEVSAEALHSGTWLICWGLFKKVVIADNVAAVANTVFAMESPDALQVAFGAWAFAVQIYCDFSGYTDIARGVARLLGFELSLNFNLPYVAQNPSDFWRRWHISLSSWLRDYLYISLGGNRGTTGRTYANLMLTMLLGGLWHGAAWTFVAWGAMHGAMLCAYRAATPWWNAHVSLPEGFRGAAIRFLNGLFFFQLVCVTWILFRAEDFGNAARMFGGLARLPADFTESWYSLGDMALFLSVVAPLVVMQAAQHLSKDQLVIFRVPVPLRSVLYAAGFLMFLFVGEFGGEAFIYFQF